MLKISVLVINYNQERFLNRTLESALSQDYPDFEIVVADDCSTDGSRDIIRRFATKCPEKFVLVFNEKNRGITQNAISGFERCSGDLIAYLDGDDEYRPGKLHAQARLFNDPEVVLSYSAAEIFDSVTGRILCTTNVRKREDIRDAYDIITKMGIPHTSSIMVRRSACPEYGFDRRIPHVSDWLFEIEVALRGKIAKLDGVYSRYRKHSANAGNRLSEFKHEFEQVLDIVGAKYGADPRVAEACRRGRARYLAGEAFRSIPESPESAMALLRRAIELDPSYRYRIARVACGLRPLRAAAVNAKYFLKRYFG